MCVLRDHGTQLIPYKRERSHILYYLIEVMCPVMMDDGFACFLFKHDMADITGQVPMEYTDSAGEMRIHSPGALISVK